MVSMTTRVKMSVKVTSDATIQVRSLKVIMIVALMYRVENDVFYEELKSMNRTSSQMATVLQKDSMF